MTGTLFGVVVQQGVCGFSQDCGSGSDDFQLNIATINVWASRRKERKEKKRRKKGKRKEKNRTEERKDMKRKI